MTELEAAGKGDPPQQPNVPPQRQPGSEQHDGAKQSAPNGGSHGEPPPVPPSGQPPPAAAAESAASRATSAKGSGTDENEHLRNAQQRLINGDYVAGNKFVYYIGGEERRLRIFSPQLFAEVRATFVDPEGWADVREAFRPQRTTILRGEIGHGRISAAIRLLQATNCDLVYQLSPDVNLSELAKAIETDSHGNNRIETGAAFVINQPTDLSHLSSFVVDSLDAALLSAGARLVIIVGRDDHLTHDDLLRFIIDLPKAPERLEILTSHLRSRLGDEKRADAWLAQEDMKELLADILADDATCAATAALAQIISQEPGDKADVKRIREAWAQRSMDSFGIWFDGLRDDSRSFAIALAVLDGLPYDDVAEAARRLRPKLTGALPTTASGKATTSPVRDPFHTNVSRQLETLHAQQAQAHARRSYGYVPVSVVEYKDPAYPRQVIERVWSSYQIQNLLLSWLTELVDHSADRDLEVLVRTCTALGLLARSSFDHILTNVFVPWSNSEKSERRTAVAYALRTTAAETHLRGPVERVVGSWYINREAPRQQETAALAHGLSLGPQDPAAAIAKLDRLATVADFDVGLAIGHGLAALVAENAAGTAPAVLTALCRWLDDRRRRETAQFSFLVIASNLLTRVFTDDRSASWPTLLYLATRRSALRDPLVELWRRMLDSAFLHDVTQDVFTFWASCAEVDTELREAFVRLARAIAGGDSRSADILRRVAARWVADDNLAPLPTVEAAISDAIGR